MRYFIYNNLKVNPFVIQDKPFPGFELVTWDHQTSTIGTLLNLGFDAAYIEAGHMLVKGQLWKSDDRIACRKLEDVFLTGDDFVMIDVKVCLSIEDEQVKTDAITFALKQLKPGQYNPIPTGQWNFPKKADFPEQEKS